MSELDRKNFDLIFEAQCKCGAPLEGGESLCAACRDWGDKSQFWEDGE